jgi:hypothetical protein
MKESVMGWAVLLGGIIALAGVLFAVWRLWWVGGF